MSDRVFRNNEDIILTTKRLFPDKQNMADPNSVQTLYRGGDITVTPKKVTVENLIPRLELMDDGSVVDEWEQRRFMEEMMNSCHCCGVDISNYKAMYPELYSFSLCERCNTDLEESVGSKNKRKLL